MNNIGIICPYLLPVPAVNGGAVETLVEQFLKNNEELHVPLTVFSIDSDEAREKAKLYPATNFIWLNYNINQKAGKINAILRKLGFSKRLHPAIHAINKKDLAKMDVIVVENDANAILPLRDKFSGKIVLHDHSDNIVNNKDAKKIIKECNKIIFVSHFLENRVKKIHPTVCSSVLWNGIDLDLFSPKGRDTSEFVRFGYLGRLTKEKGVDKLLSAYKRIINEQIDQKVSLTILGSSHFSGSQTTPFVEHILEMSNSLENISFTGYIEHDHVVDYLRKCDVVVVPSQCNEALPLAAAEAAASGCRVVASDIGGIPEIIQDKVWLVTIDDHYEEELFRKMKKLVEHPRLITEGIEQQIAYLKTHFNSQDYLQRMLSIIFED